MLYKWYDCIIKYRLAMYCIECYQCCSHTCVRYLTSTVCHVMIFYPPSSHGPIFLYLLHSQEEKPTYMTPLQVREVNAEWNMKWSTKSIFLTLWSHNRWYFLNFKWETTLITSIISKKELIWIFYRKQVHVRNIMQISLPSDIVSNLT